MPTLIETLASFNRKERFHLVGQALGNPNFKLSEKFRGELSRETGITVPCGASCWMDYHLDSLYAALWRWSHDGQTSIEDNSRKYITGTQEDVDLLVAFEQGGVNHLVLVEAKGATLFTNKPMHSKSERLRLIFGDLGDKQPGVEPHFVMVSPKRPTLLLLSTAPWPQWMRPKWMSPIDGGGWIQLNWETGLVKVTRCDEEGLPNKSGKFWTVNKDKTLG